ncbi:MAG: serine/threonine protein kinase [Acidobacteria bacterium]|nr:serine/threonine protein kinase [Acidobacteriota bacterium]
MRLTAGTRLGPYEIVAPLGAGGMGEVYRARDAKLGRDVALKILPESVAQDVDRVARFKREAQVLASLNHPHIAGIYGFDEAAGTQFLVLELVEGETLADRLKRGPIPVDETIAIARQIAEALAEAHEKGIIHRDLKPANIALSGHDQVKVLDFGLAKLAGAPAGSASSSVSMSPTLTTPAMMTGVGMILGTAAYMAPEQAKGREADKRCDVWAFGCVVYEMLTAKRAFEGEDITDTIASIMRGEPDWTALPADTPASVRLLLESCLTKDRKQRAADIAVVQFLLGDRAMVTAKGPVPDAAVKRPEGRRALPWGIAGLACAAALALLIVWMPWRGASVSRPIRLSVDLGNDVALPPSSPGASAVVSPDGNVLAFIGIKADAPTTQLYVRRLDQLRAVLLAGTEGARDPFFSPDGQWIAFIAGSKLKKFSTTGGAAADTVCSVGNARGGTWAEDGTIVFQSDTTAGFGLMRVSSSGGTPELYVATTDKIGTARWPQMLPGGRAILYTTAARSAFESANIVVQSLPGGAAKVVQHGGYAARYVPSGHLLYLHEGTLFAVPFSLERLELTGPAVPVVEGVSASTVTGGAQFDVSGSGTLVYTAGVTRGYAGTSIQMMDRTGKAATLRAVLGDWANPRFSPDGQRLAVDVGDGKQTDVWVYEWARDTATRFTFDPRNDSQPVWTPDGRRIVFSSARGGAANLYWQHADGTGDVQRLTESANAQAPASWHPSGQFLAFEENHPQTGLDLMILPLSGTEATGWKPGKPTVFLSTQFIEREPAFSPDGRWLAYTSDESGRTEVYVRPFPGPGGKWQISNGGGSSPTWSRAHRELLYRGTDNDSRLRAVSYTMAGDSFRADQPRIWSDRSLNPLPGQRWFDLHPDGERVALSPRPEASQAKQDKVVLVFNFLDELRRLAPVAKR